MIYYGIHWQLKIIILLQVTTCAYTYNGIICMQSVTDSMKDSFYTGLHSNNTEACYASSTKHGKTILTWSYTPVGCFTTSVELCLSDTGVPAHRYCNKKKESVIGYWGKPIIADNCKISINQLTLDLKLLSSTNLENYSFVPAHLRNLTSQSQNIKPVDLHYVVITLEYLAMFLFKFPNNSNFQMINNVVWTVNNVMQANTSVLKEANQHLFVTNRLLRRFEAILLVTDSVTPASQLTTPNLVVKTHKVPISERIIYGWSVKGMSSSEMFYISKIISEHFPDPSAQLSVKLPANYIQLANKVKNKSHLCLRNSQKDTITLLFILYRTNGLFMVNQDDVSFVNAPVLHLHAQYCGENLLSTFDNSISVAFLEQDIERRHFEKCAVWDFNGSEKKGTWSFQGCITVYSDDSYVVCQCLSNAYVSLLAYNDKSEFLSDVLTSFYELEIKETTFESITEQLDFITEDARLLTANHIHQIKNIFEKLINGNYVSTNEKVIKNIVNVVSHLFDINQTQISSNTDTNKDYSRIIQLFENYSHKIVKHHCSNESFISMPIASKNIELQFQKVIEREGYASMSYNPAIDSASVTLPRGLTQELAGKNVTAVFTFYRTSTLFVSSLIDDINQGEVSSPVVSVKLFTSTEDLQKLSQNIFMNFRLLQNGSLKKYHPECVHWDFNFNGWSNAGCTVYNISGNQVICSCGHLTNFAVLLGPHYFSSSVHNYALDTITYIGCGLSIFCLVVTIVSIIVMKTTRNGRGQQVLLNLCLALLASLLIFVSGINQTENRDVCIAIGVLLHYFLLVAFMWMLVEALLHYLNFVKVVGTYIEGFVWKTVLIAWGIPAIFVSLLLFDLDNYVDSSKYCWISKSNVFYYFVLPIGMIILTNFIVYVIILRAVCRSFSKLNNTYFWIKFRAALCTLTLIGLTWGFALFIFINPHPIFKYLFCIFNTLQGFFIFIFHILIIKNKPEWKKVKRNLQKTSSLWLQSSRDSSSSPKKQNEKILYNNVHV